VVARPDALMGLLQGLVDLATQIIGALGYPGVFLLMVMESMVFPVPSEAVMPFAGFLVAEGRFHSVLLVTTVATIGSIVGSSLSYWMGLAWGEPFVRKFGKWFLITPHDWELTQRFFRKAGGWSVFLARFIPGVRHLISIPAGAARMKWAPFLLATFVGAFLWNGFLAYLGWQLGDNWEQIGAWMEPFEYLVLGVLVLLAGLYVVWHLRRMRRQHAPLEKPEGP
jgi:membrane protein DedA with SNARE-associated domain